MSGDGSTPAGRPNNASAPVGRPESAGLPEAASPAEACGSCPASREGPTGQAIAWATLPPFDAWEQFLGRLRAQGDMAIHAVLAEFGLVGLGDGVVRLVGSNHYRDMLQQHRGLIDQQLHLHMGAPFRLELAEGEPSLPEVPSLRLIERQRQEALQAEVLQEARAHPHIQALIAQFDGQLKQVRPLVSPPGK